MQKKIQLDSWQKEFLAHDGNCLLCTGRQIGKTTSAAAKAANYMLNKPKSQILVVSLTEDQAKLIIIMILYFLELENKQKIARGKHKPTQNKITLTNGSSVLARPTGTHGDALRGFTGDVLIIDEAAAMPEFVFTSAKPTLLSTGGQIWMLSTPRGKQGYFYESFLNKNNRFKVWHVSSWQAIHERPLSDGWTQQQRDAAIQFLEEERRDMSELQFGQEYMGLFLDDLQQFFDDALIESCCIRRRDAHLSSKYPLYMGVDIARLGGDHSTFQIIQKRGDFFVHVESIAKKGLLTTQTEREIIDLNYSWQPHKIGIDAGAGTLGVSIYDHLREISGIGRKIVALNNRQIALDREGKKTQRLMKEDMYMNLRGMMERGEISLLKDEHVIRSLKSIQFEIVKEKGYGAKLQFFSNPHNASDIVEGLIRAAWLAKEAKGFNYWIDSI